MKTSLIFLALVAMVISFASCKKSSNTDQTSQQLAQTESKLKLDYSQAQTYQNILVERHKTPGMTMTDPTCKMNDSLFHACDTSFTIHMQEYCKAMMSNMGMGSNGMMGGGMMGGGNSGGMMCNMDSMMTKINGMMNMTTFKMDSMMENHMKNCPKMGTLSATVQGYMDNMQTMRKAHMQLHK